MRARCERRIAFSTLGCPGAGLPDVIRYASASGCTGVELRYAEGEPVHPGQSIMDLAVTGRRLSEAGVTPVALASYLKVAADGPTGPGAGIVTELCRHIEAAEAIGARYLRVFAGGGEASPAADERAVRRLATVAGAARDAGVGLLLETHDSHRRAADAARVLARTAEATGLPSVDGVPVGAIWDVLHTWLGGETPTESAVLLSRWLGYVQLKDIVGPDDTTPVPPGAGVLPLTEVLAELDRRGYTGWISLEYERAWYPGIPPLGDVLPGFVAFAAGS